MDDQPIGDVGNDREEQRRELEELRRSFHEIGIKVGAFEPARHNHTSHTSSEHSPPAAAPVEGRRVVAWPVSVVAALLVCLLLGGGVGYLVHRPAAGAGVPTTSVVTRVVPSPPKTRVVAPPACLETARRADELMDLFTRKVRDRRLSLALKQYTLASQACRKEASP